MELLWPLGLAGAPEMPEGKEGGAHVTKGPCSPAPWAVESLATAFVTAVAFPCRPTPCCLGRDTVPRSLSPEVLRVSYHPPLSMGLVLTTPEITSEVARGPLLFSDSASWSNVRCSTESRNREATPGHQAVAVGTARAPGTLSAVCSG